MCASTNPETRDFSRGRFIAKTNLHKKEKFLWIILVKLGLTWIVIHTVNELMTTISLTGFAEFLTALLLVSVDIVFDDEKNN